MRATWNGETIAEAPKENLIYIEGNWYFSPYAIKKELYSPSDMQTECHWKGAANYYNVTVGGETNESAAWYYAHPKDGSIERVGKDFTNYVAFWNGVTVGK